MSLKPVNFTYTRDTIIVIRLLKSNVINYTKKSLNGEDKECFARENSGEFLDKFKGFYASILYTYNASATFSRIAVGK